MALPVNGSTHLILADYSFIVPVTMKGWVGLVGWPITDGLPTLVVTHQLQVERRTGKVRQSETDVLPLCHATNCSQNTFVKSPLKCQLLSAGLPVRMRLKKFQSVDWVTCSFTWHLCIRPSYTWDRRHYVFELSICLCVRKCVHAEEFSEQLYVNFYT